MGTIFNHAFGSTKLNRPQEELNQGVQITGEGLQIHIGSETDGTIHAPTDRMRTWERGLKTDQKRMGRGWDVDIF
uniref:Uncharacterized protein n=1 Tax=Caenorhabditis japonica TaxID=281687 RepID=A0A8R1ID30_CAEJA